MDSIGEEKDGGEDDEGKHGGVRTEGGGWSRMEHWGLEHWESRIERQVTCHDRHFAGMNGREGPSTSRAGRSTRQKIAGLYVKCCFVCSGTHVHNVLSFQGKTVSHDATKCRGHGGV